MISFAGWSVPDDFKSDGCTGAPDSWFGIDLTPACRLHDFLRRHLVWYNIVTVQEADKLLKHHIRALGAPRFLGHFYWLGVKITRNKYKATYPFPSSKLKEWSKYLKNNNINTNISV